jgi:hypothetical protein
MCNKLLFLTEIYTLSELAKHIGKTNVKYSQLCLFVFGSLNCTFSNSEYRMIEQLVNNELSRV